ncbi:hypothetical protein BO71DRAFT_330833, partial [Aspergillus ellipticus CBS 707.79]
HTTTGCGEQGFPSAQPYLSHTPGANPFCCMFLAFFFIRWEIASCRPSLQPLQAVHPECPEHHYIAPEYPARA